MTTSFKKIGLAAFLAGTMLSGAANALTEQNTASVTILEPLTVTADNNMNFGKITKPATTGSVTITDTGSATYTNVSNIGGATAAGTFLVTGDTANTISMQITSDNNVPGLTLSNFTGDLGGQAIAGDIIAGATITGGNEIVAVGATLSIDSTVAGFDTGLLNPSYTVEVAYD